MSYVFQYLLWKYMYAKKLVYSVNSLQLMINSFEIFRLIWFFFSSWFSICRILHPTHQPYRNTMWYTQNLLLVVITWVSVCIVGEPQTQNAEPNIVPMKSTSPEAVCRPCYERGDTGPAGPSGLPGIQGPSGMPGKESHRIH